ncbi:MAG: hypothetical protein LBC42_02080 [Puniceicoccales bacterium]|jgi:hypothetical protein|nr:hypothetical protein [Puniceicoccales bacterium]
MLALGTTVVYWYGVACAGAVGVGVVGEVVNKVHRQFARGSVPDVAAAVIGRYSEGVIVRDELVAKEPDYLREHGLLKLQDRGRKTDFAAKIGAMKRCVGSSIYLLFWLAENGGDALGQMLRPWIDGGADRRELGSVRIALCEFSRAHFGQFSEDLAFQLLRAVKMSSFDLPDYSTFSTEDLVASQAVRLIFFDQHARAILRDRRVSMAAVIGSFVREKIAELPANLYGLNDGIANFMELAYVRQGHDFMEDFIRARYAFKMEITADIFVRDVAAMTIDDICLDRIRQSAIHLIMREDFVHSPEMQQFFVRLFWLYTNRERMLGNLIDIATHAPAPRIATLSTLQTPRTQVQIARLILASIFVEDVRQERGIGSCFAASALANAQAKFPWLLLKFLRDIWCDGQATAVSALDVTVTETVPANPYEKIDATLNPSHVLWHMATRTVADLTVAIGGRELDEAMGMFRRLVDELRDSLVAVGYPHAAQLLYEPPSYDSTHFSETASGGTWTPHIGFPGDRTLRAVCDNGEHGILTEIERQLNAQRRAIEGVRPLSDDERGKFTDAKVRISNLRACHIAIPMSTQPIVGDQRISRTHSPAICLSGGGSGLTAMRVLGKTMRRHSPPKSFTKAEDVFCHWFAIMKDPIFAEAPLILARGEGHAYNLKPILSVELTRALKDPAMTAERFLAEIVREEGTPALFIDPNWDGFVGVSIRWVGSTFGCKIPYKFERAHRFELFYQTTNGETRVVQMKEYAIGRLAEEKIEGYPCFFRYLEAYRELI